MRKVILERADEVLCRVSNEKIALVTKLGKCVLPRGYWGQAGAHYERDPHVYMTFDDGPHPDTTPQLLELLAENGLHATFFLIGSNCERHPELVKSIHDAGHTIGNHTYSHIPMPLISTSKIESEIARTNDIIEQIVGEAPTIFRPPFGIMDHRTAKILKEREMTPVYWGSAPEDWLIPGPSRVIRRVMWKITDGTLIVLHEGGLLASQTLTAAKEIVYRCKSLGYQFSKVNVRAGFQGS
jgi:peptidoglycan/xylan/chitin deacetylase (PgdA/CDA1 family)